MPKKTENAESLFSGITISTLTLNAEKAKELLGWKEESDYDKVPKKEHFLTYKKVVEDKKVSVKVWLENNQTNRPFKSGASKRYFSEIMRGKWKLNGETIAISEKKNIVDGQNRLIALVLASSEFEDNYGETIKKFPGLKGLTEIAIPVILVEGISDEKEVGDTANLGVSRSLKDVIFRNHNFKGSIKEQTLHAKVQAGALRLAWLRMNGKTVSSAPHFPHSEALEFEKKHPKLAEQTKAVCGFDFNAETGEKSCISKYVSLSYASALSYLFATSDTTGKKIDLGLMAMATEFWQKLASGESKGSGDLFGVLRSTLLACGASGKSERDEICGIIIKAMLLFKEGKVNGIAKKDLTMKRKKDGDKFVLAEEPRLGGLDQKIPEIELEETPIDDEADLGEEEEADEEESEESEEE